MSILIRPHALYLYLIQFLVQKIFGDHVLTKNELLVPQLAICENCSLIIFVHVKFSPITKKRDSSMYELEPLNFPMIRVSNILRLRELEMKQVYLINPAV